MGFSFQWLDGVMACREPSWISLMCRPKKCVVEIYVFGSLVFGIVGCFDQYDNTTDGSVANKFGLGFGRF